MEIGVLFFAVRNRYEKSSTNIEPINVRSIVRMLLYMTQVRGLQPMHPHLLRHACATHMLDNGCPLDVIAHLLGHDNLDVTAHYAQVSTRLMMDTYNSSHPYAERAAGQLSPEPWSKRILMPWTRKRSNPRSSPPDS